jgi:hypothetical protein
MRFDRFGLANVGSSGAPIVDGFWLGFNETSSPVGTMPEAEEP